MTRVVVFFSLDLLPSLLWPRNRRPQAAPEGIAASINASAPTGKNVARPR